jgi:hypothetical protein
MLSATERLPSGWIARAGVRRDMGVGDGKRVRGSIDMV